MKSGISILICTYNGAERLAKTLYHIAHQQIDIDFPWEVIIVDNASTDNSVQVAEESWKSYTCPAPLRILYQPRQGLNYARQLGFAESQFAYILICDDDNWLAANYLNTAYTIMQRHPTIGVLGGHGELVYEIDPPDWVAQYPIHASGAQASQSGVVYSFGVYGAGSILRKSAYEALCLVGFEFLLTDRIGSQLSSGGDFELCHAIALTGYLIYYDKHLHFKHYITKERITWNYYVRYLNEDARSHIVLEPYQILLDINTDDLLYFRLKLVRNLSFYMLHLFFNKLKKIKLIYTSASTELVDLKIIALKAKVSIYKHHQKMAENFRKAAVLRQHFTL